MAKSAEVGDPSQHAAPGKATPARRKNGNAVTAGVPPLVKYTRRSALTKELGRWYALDQTARLDELKHTAAGAKDWNIEVFVHAARQAWAAGDRRQYVLSTNALATRATPLLMRQAVKYDAGEDEDHAQHVLLITATEIQAGKAEYAEANFADYAMRKAISAHRHKDTAIESKRERVESIAHADEGDAETSDPINELPDHMASPEVLALLNRALDKLSPKLRAVLIQYHIHRLTLEELAEHYEVDPTTISNWVKLALELAGYQGGKDDDEN